jgi:hypothetical protein
MHGLSWEYMQGSVVHLGRERGSGVEHQDMGWDMHWWQDGNDKAGAWGKDMVVGNSVNVDNRHKVEMEPIEVQGWEVLPHQQNQVWWQPLW